MALQNRKIAFIGGGQITEIIVSNLTACNKLPPQQLFVSNLVKDKLKQLRRKYDIALLKDNTEVVSKGDFVFINEAVHRDTLKAAEFSQS
jgi:pyrroline-5-carboxylate reductase